MRPPAQARARALIVSADPLAAALVGAAAELAGLVALFPVESTSPREALRALRATHLLIDCEDAAAADETLLGNALMLGVRLFFFGADHAHASLDHLRSRYRVTPLVFPRDVERLPALLVTGGSESTHRPPRPTVQ